MPAKNPDKCAYPKCNRWSDLIYLDRPVCDKHWAMIDTNPDKLRAKLKLPPYPKREKPKSVVPEKARGRRPRVVVKRASQVRRRG